MLLQVYLYYYCAVLVEYTEIPTTVFLYAIERVQKLCARWQHFFSPSMLRTLGESMSPKEQWAWSEVMYTDSCVSYIASICNNILAACREGNQFVMGWHCQWLRMFLRSTALPTFLDLGYSTTGNGKLLMFDKTSKYLTSLVPIETQDTAEGAPAVFSIAERLVLTHYMETLCHAPSLVAAAGVDFDDRPRYIWVEGHLAIQYASNSWEELLFQDRPATPAEICEKIYEQWCSETSQVDEIQGGL